MYLFQSLSRLRLCILPRYFMMWSGLRRMDRMSTKPSQKDGPPVTQQVHVGTNLSGGASAHLPIGGVAEGPRVAEFPRPGGQNQRIADLAYLVNPITHQLSENAFFVHLSVYSSELCSVLQSSLCAARAVDVCVG